MKKQLGPVVQKPINEKITRLSSQKVTYFEVKRNTKSDGGNVA